ncbi:MAG: NAD(P)-binding domain-containing protein [Lapillicoccus sp.]
MPHVTVIGTGNMGQAIAGVLTKGGATVDLVRHGDSDAEVTGDIVVLAVPYPALQDVVARRGASLDGKVVVDITNPLNFETFDSLTVPADGSAAAELSEQLPGAKVLKAFNTTFAATLAAGTVGDAPTTVLIAGDDADAKAALADVVTAGGLRALDAGKLSRARELEALGFLQLTMAAAERIPWTGGFAVLP